MHDVPDHAGGAPCAPSHLLVPHSRLPDVVGQLALAVGADVGHNASLLHDFAGHCFHDGGDGFLAKLRLGQGKQLVEWHGAALCRRCGPGNGHWAAPTDAGCVKCAGFAEGSQFSCCLTLCFLGPALAVPTPRHFPVFIAWRGPFEVQPSWEDPWSKCTTPFR